MTRKSTKAIKLEAQQREEAGNVLFSQFESNLDRSPYDATTSIEVKDGKIIITVRPLDLSIAPLNESGKTQNICKAKIKSGSIGGTLHLWECLDKVYQEILTDSPDFNAWKESRVKERENRKANGGKLKPTESDIDRERKRLLGIAA